MNKPMSLIAAFSIVLALAAVAFAADLTITKHAGELTVNASINHNPPVVGKNNISIAVTDGAGKPVTDAKVRVEYTMPAMPGMPAMNYKAETKASGNAFEAVLDLSMAGPWDIAVKVARGGKTSTIKFNVDVR